MLVWGWVVLRRLRWVLTVEGGSGWVVVGVVERERVEKRIPAPLLGMGLGLGMRVKLGAWARVRVAERERRWLVVKVGVRGRGRGRGRGRVAGWAVATLLSQVPRVVLV
jgi:hypothetical protein